ncbi:MAG: H4MPT-linked C1 transfer pathway protein [Acidobacteria bacterium]|nr:H4MPT-linked C1 transfer pathway protein [Acidobacteriota bacterium]MDW7983338.1 hydantoinase/oxoprolinase family protein [Acidobacteriota bacterium]
MSLIVGWDVGGVHTKAAALEYESGAVPDVRVVARPFEIWRAKDRLPDLLRKVLAELTDRPPQAMALTMTAELSDVFRTKREGVRFVLDSVGAAFPEIPVYVLSLAGEWVPRAEAYGRPLDFAADNWLATALYAADVYRDALVLDVGSTTTDVIPVRDGQVAALGRTDLDRLLHGELVYTGVLRTPLAAIVRSVPLRGRFCPVSSEYFAVTGDVYLVLGRIRPEDYTCPTPDGRPPTAEFARERLARLVCADVEELTPAEVDALAAYVYESQLWQLEAAVRQVRSRLGDRADLPVLPLGAGAFLAEEVARRIGLPLLDLPPAWGPAGGRVAPCVAAAYLLRSAVQLGSIASRRHFPSSGEPNLSSH